MIVRDLKVRRSPAECPIMSSNPPRANYAFLDDMSDLLRAYADNRANDNDVTRPVARRVPDWDEYFHAIAQVVALRSKDGKQVGAVVVGEGQTIISTGFNGFARGIRETDERQAEDEKLVWVTHAETNAIFNAARSGVSLVGSTLYVTFFPCPTCAQAIVQSGIKRVFTYSEKYWVKVDPGNRWEIALDILAEGHVAVDAPNLRAEEAAHWIARKKREKDGGVKRAVDRPATKRKNYTPSNQRPAARTAKRRAR